MRTGGQQRRGRGSGGGLPQCEVGKREPVAGGAADGERGAGRRGARPPAGTGMLLPRGVLCTDAGRGPLALELPSAGSALGPLRAGRDSLGAS